MARTDVIRSCYLSFSLVIELTSHFEATRGCFGADLLILNYDQMTRTKPELEPPFPNLRTTPAGGLLTHFRFSVHQAHEHTGSLVVSSLGPFGFEA
ncbi:hypothetical protein AVEN_255251-1 [Araneus ventricosus]|uniref:Uncharacterized protein n=1 Tax=Araneus ventricosus TaxID=182803 RepID=A0A4Y2BCB7_ARAVE|nr:hypothetical protein AVEN_255251-1 [Araneus ventricosus]